MICVKYLKYMKDFWRQRVNSLGHDTCLFDCYAYCMSKDVHELAKTAEMCDIPVSSPHPEELLPLALVLGYHPIVISAQPRKDTAVSHSNPMGFVYPNQDYKDRLHSFVSKVNSVLLFNTHAVAYDREKNLCFDPKGRTMTLEAALLATRGAILFYGDRRH